MTISAEISTDRSVRRRWRFVLCALALFAVSCGGGDDTTEPDTGPDDNAQDDSSTDDGASDGATLANAIRIDASVDARIADAADYTDVSDPVPVNAGDNVRTDTTGFAEIAYFDGSVTRLDIDTDFTVVELVNSPGDSVIRTQMGVGRTWHRVQALTGNDTYEVETAVATAVVRGTAFIITCDATACTFTVLEGTIELILPDGTTITLQAGETITITIDTAPGDPTPITGNPFDDEWLARNNDLDTDTGGDDLTDEAAGQANPAPGVEGLEGTWSVQFEFVEATREEDPQIQQPDPIAELTEEWTITCTADACTVDRFDLPAGPLVWPETTFGQPAPQIRFEDAADGLAATAAVTVDCSAVGESTRFDQALVIDTLDVAAGTFSGTLTRTWDPLSLRTADDSASCFYTGWTYTMDGTRR